MLAYSCEAVSAHHLNFRENNYGSFLDWEFRIFRTKVKQKHIIWDFLRKQTTDFLLLELGPTLGFFLQIIPGGSAILCEFNLKINRKSCLYKLKLRILAVIGP